MPRKTIAGLEAEIEKLIRARNELADALNSAREHINQLQARPPETYLTYKATGDVEMDALQVCARAIASLQGPEARARCGAYLEERFRLPPKED